MRSADGPAPGQPASDLPSAGKHLLSGLRVISAGTLIDQCGLKGLTVGGAQVSEKHAGFVSSTGAAPPCRRGELIAQIQREVLDRTGVALEPEVKIIRN